MEYVKDGDGVLKRKEHDLEYLWVDELRKNLVG